MKHIDLIEIMMHGLMAFIGGVVKIITESQEHVKKSLMHFVAGGFVGVFAGMVTYFICKHFGIGEYLSITFTGLAGYMGAPFLDLFSAVCKRIMLGLFGFHIIEEKKNKDENK